MKLKTQLYILTFIFVSTTINMFSKQDISTIKITSNKATFTKNKYKKYILKYFDDVTVLLDEKTKIKSDNVRIEINRTDKKKKMIKSVDKIILNGNIHILHKNKIISADNAIISLPKKKCTLRGNVKLKQIKKNSGELQIETYCNRLFLDLNSKKIESVGSYLNPVNTIINIANNRKLKINKKLKT